VKLKVRVIPNARKSEFAGCREDEWILRLNAPPVDGKANKAAVEVIAKALGISRSGVSLISGEKGRHKIFEIVGFQPSDVARKLAQSGT
jgi:uncharacterized protein (TIGR00251 family)